MNRINVLRLLAASLVATGCSPQSALQIGSKSGSSRLRISSRTAKGLPFPQSRPDGSMPAKHHGQYKPDEHFGASIGRQTEGSTCPQIVGGGCGGGPQPNASVALQNRIGYAWSSQNYVEHWDSVNDVLLMQVYMTPSADGATCGLQYLLPSGSGVTVSVPAPSQYPSEGSFVSADGTISGSISEANGTMSMYHSATGITVASSISGSTQTVSASRGNGGGLHINVPPAVRARIHCGLIHAQNSALLASAYLAAAQTISAACGEGSDASDCQLVSLIVSAALASYQDYLKAGIQAACDGG